MILHARDIKISERNQHRTWITKVYAITKRPDKEISIALDGSGGHLHNQKPSKARLDA